MLEFSRAQVLRPPSPGLLGVVIGVFVEGGWLFMFVGRSRVESIESTLVAFEHRVNRVEKDMRGLYLFINAYIERVEKDDAVLSSVVPLLEDVSLMVRGLVDSFGVVGEMEDMEAVDYESV